MTTDHDPPPTAAPPPPQEPEGGLVAELRSQQTVCLQRYKLANEICDWAEAIAFEKAIVMARPHEAELASLRTRLETAEGALRAIVAVRSGTTIDQCVEMRAIAELALKPEEPARDGGDETTTYEQRSIYACKVCGNVPDEFGTIDHGRGCYTQSEDGGGSSWVDLSEIQPPTARGDEEGGTA